MPRLASLLSSHACTGLSLVLFVACGGEVEDFRTDGASPTPDAATSKDAGRCTLTPGALKLVPTPGNSTRCSQTETCQILTGHGAYFMDCRDPSGIGASSECDKSACSCMKGNVTVDFSEEGRAFDKKEPATCSYSVESVK